MKPFFKIWSAKFAQIKCRIFGVTLLKGKLIKVPTFRIAHPCEIRLSEVKARRFYIIDRSQIIAKMGLKHRKNGRTTVFHKLPYERETEDEKIFRAISGAIA